MTFYRNTFDLDVFPFEFRNLCFLFCIFKLLTVGIDFKSITAAFMQYCMLYQCYSFKKKKKNQIDRETENDSFVELRTVKLQRIFRMREKNKRPYNINQSAPL